jgi:hypothetical protein
MDSIFVWQVLDREDNQWGAIATYIPALGSVLPLQNRKLEVARLMEPMAREHAKGTKSRIRLVQYDFAQVIIG